MEDLFNLNQRKIGKKIAGQQYRIIPDHPLSKGLLEVYLMNGDHKGLLGHDLTPDNHFYNYFAPNDGSLANKVVNTVSNSGASVASFIPNSSPVTVMLSVTDFLEANWPFRDNVSSSIIVRKVTATSVDFIINSLSNDRVAHSIVEPQAGEALILGGTWGGSGTKLAVASRDSAGFKYTENGTASTGSYTSSIIALPNPQGLGVDGFYNWCMIWNRPLSEEELRSFTADPYQFVEPITSLQDSVHAALFVTGGVTFQPAWAKNNNILIGAL